MATIKVKITTDTNDTSVELYAKGVATGTIYYVPHNTVGFLRKGGTTDAGDYFDIYQNNLAQQNNGVNIQRVKYDEMIIDGVTPVSAAAAVTALKAAFFFNIGGGGGAWGDITGTISDQTDLQNALSDRVLISSVTATPTSSSIPQWNTQANLSADNFLSGFTSTATVAGTTTLTVDSTYNQVFTGSTTQTVVLPTATTLVNGLSFFITNLSSGNITVNTSGSNTVQVMAGNTSLLITCINTAGGTGTASWSWSYSNNGAGLVDAFILSASGGTYATATPAQLALSYLTYKGWNYPTALRVNRDKFEYIPPPVVQSAISNIAVNQLRANWAIPQRTNISTSNENAVVDTYECQISTSSTFASILQTQYSTGTTYTFTSLTTATLYYTRIRACLSTIYSGEYEYGAFSNTVNATTA